MRIPEPQPTQNPGSDEGSGLRRGVAAIAPGGRLDLDPLMHERATPTERRPLEPRTFGAITASSRAPQRMEPYERTGSGEGEGRSPRRRDGSGNYERTFQAPRERRVGIRSDQSPQGIKDLKAEDRDLRRRRSAPARNARVIRARAGRHSKTPQNSPAGLRQASDVAVHDLLESAGTQTASSVLRTPRSAAARPGRGPASAGDPHEKVQDGSRGASRRGDPKDARHDESPRSRRRAADQSSRPVRSGTTIESREQAAAIVPGRRGRAPN